MIILVGILSYLIIGIGVMFSAIYVDKSYGSGTITKELTSGDDQEFVMCMAVIFWPLAMLFFAGCLCKEVAIKLAEKNAS